MTTAPIIILPLMMLLVATGLASDLTLTDTSVAQTDRMFADARSYRHCHNTPRRTYCHTKEPLPITIRPQQTELMEPNSYGSELPDIGSLRLRDQSQV
jgi:hypothetical protein